MVKQTSTAAAYKAHAMLAEMLDHSVDFMEH
jgi:hypothetical protein